VFAFACSFVFVFFPSLNEVFFFFFLSCSTNEYLPIEYTGPSRKLDRDIIFTYKKLNGMSEDNAKIAYLKNVRYLKTWGFTFFRVEVIKSTNQPSKQTNEIIHFFSLSLFSLLFEENPKRFSAMQSSLWDFERTNSYPRP
jgi:hypothetical protein